MVVDYPGGLEIEAYEKAIIRIKYLLDVDNDFLDLYNRYSGGMMNQTGKKSSETQDLKGKTELNIAKIGLISAIAVAIIGLVGIGVTAYFSSQSAQAPILISIQATQTAEAKAVEEQVAIAPTETAKIPTSTIEPTMMVTPTDQNPTAIPSSIPTAIPTEITQDWGAIFQIYTLGSCEEPVVIPSSFDIEGDPETAVKQIFESNDSNDNEPWQIGPGGRRYISLARNIVSKSENKEWIQLSNTTRVTIRGNDSAPDHVNVMMNCAGAGNKRVFPPIELDPQFNQYEVSTTYQEADFFSLQPGEFESLNFIFHCKTPGTYSVILSIDYLYLGQPGKITINSPDLICPQSYSLWEIWDLPFPSIRLGDYVWNGTSYVETQ